MQWAVTFVMSDHLQPQVCLVAGPSIVGTARVFTGSVCAGEEEKGLQTPVAQSGEGTKEGDLELWSVVSATGGLTRRAARETLGTDDLVSSRERETGNELAQERGSLYPWRKQPESMNQMYSEEEEKARVFACKPLIFHLHFPDELLHLQFKAVVAHHLPGLLERALR